MGSAGRWILTLFASPAGVFVLAALDSTLFFSLPLGIDTIVVLLSARLGNSSWIVPLLATSGSLAGAALTFWMGIKIGEAGLDRYVASKRLDRIRRRIATSGALALAALDLIPPPFPFTPFLLAAGALGVNSRLFFGTLAACRLFRFGVEAALAARYGQAIIGVLESDLFQTVVVVITLAAIAAAILTTVKLIRSARTSVRPTGFRARA